MRKHISDRPYSYKVTEAVLFVIDAIKRKRKPGLITDTDIAKHLGCANQTVHYWRVGERSVTLDQLCEVVVKFKVNPTFLLKQEGSPWGEADVMLLIKALEERTAEIDLRLTNLEKSKGIKSGTNTARNSKS